MQFTATARRVGVWSAVATAVLTLAYAVTLLVGLLSLRSSAMPIADPMFTIMEVLIILLVPALVALFAAVHAWAPPDAKVLTLVALVFMALLACVTASIHFAILTLSHDAVFARAPWAALLFAFRWPSLVYALDILAWDGFFAIAALFAAAAFRRERAIRRLLALSGLLALAGLAAVVVGDMRMRAVGIVGYVVPFPIAVLLIARLFHRASAATASGMVGTDA